MELRLAGISELSLRFAQLLPKFLFKEIWYFFKKNSLFSFINPFSSRFRDTLGQTHMLEHKSTKETTT